MQTPTYHEARKIWDRINRNVPTDRLEVMDSIENFKSILDLFHLGPYYYYLFNCRTGQIEYTSDSVNEVLGCSSEEFTLPYVLDHLHPDDVSVFLNHENSVVEFFNQIAPEKVYKYKVSYDYRLRKKNGQYARILQQIVVIQYGENVRTLGVHTDISHLKATGSSVLSFVGIDGEPSYLNMPIEHVFITRKEILSHREKEVLRAIVSGYASKQIADLLCITKETVDRHRKNMLGKAEVRSSAELVAKAVREGWI
ncbi:LuxR C-terminal-related transcriptional regulator [Siphonobacter curvatus]|uniref:HTH luxR-type domain-containing protein n=1 Tax=Siphonobacter curvatus TaxID=2094562 RepID=A0A2S7IGZ5_9BACT|nr:LuxR C-terminal-related transcriptional regulator [Siphonobacter curvatus]PQA54938.1 hypothetical protein C5O19_20530 [Siphonobacter curvatus]